MSDRAQNSMDGRCGARTRAGGHCRRWPMTNGRCRFHGGCSTGPRTAEGLARIRAARTIHGVYSAEAVGLRRVVAELKRQTAKLAEIV